MLLPTMSLIVLGDSVHSITFCPLPKQGKDFRASREKPNGWLPVFTSAWRGQLNNGSKTAGSRCLCRAWHYPAKAAWDMLA